jgi:hypothetical protein
MRSNPPIERAERSLAGLKDFQRRTVDYAFDRLYGADQTKRILVSDEVGLGKTMVARGLIARAMVHLWDEVPRLDVIYICSNQDIARQNMNRLGTVADSDGAIHATRLTLLASRIAGLQQEKTNFLALTPQTSFDMGGSLGIAHERAVLYWLLKACWGFSRTMGPYKVLQGNAGIESFQNAVYCAEPEGHEIAAIAKAYQAQLAEDGALQEEFNSLCEALARRTASLPDDLRMRRNNLVGKLRSVLAKTCVTLLEPDLVILDEFQRFKDLMNGQGEDAELARHLFDYHQARVVLLSATPYKMLTLASAGEDEDHYKDFLDTLSFLITDKQRLDRTINLVDDFRRRLLKLRTGGTLGAVLDVKEALERELRRVIVRTERLAATDDMRGMVSDRQMGRAPTSRDLAAFVGAQRISQAVGDRDVMEFWKSAPHLLSFLDSYKMRDKLRAAQENGAASQVAAALTKFPSATLDVAAVKRLSEVPVCNPRLSSLIEEAVECGAWQLLWMPATLPYYEAQGPFAELRKANFTKRLVFSAWKMVPRSIATLVSHAADVRTIDAFEAKAGKTGTADRWPTPLLRIQEADGRLTGMPLMLLLYPSSTLAAVDPLLIATGRLTEANALPSVAEVRTIAESKLRESLERLTRSAPLTGNVDERWYWVAPLLMDQELHARTTRDWLAQDDLAALWQGEDASASHWNRHVEAFRQMARAQPSMGRVPADLMEVLVDAALGSPAVCALRALQREIGDVEGVASRTAAARVAWSLKNQLNLPQSNAVIRALVPVEPFWKAVLRYCVMGELQSVLDEYVHVLREALGLQDKMPHEFLEKAADAVQAALSTRAGTVGVDEFRSTEDGQGFTMELHRLGSRYAMQYGASPSTEVASDADGNAVSRTGKVQDAFNSPFWPFVLASTSQGQEGLDFHPYCHCVVHWNLPSNPVDLEQREGRVHRFKGHAVRKNVAARHGAAGYRGGGNPWKAAFGSAKAARAPEQNDLVPYWIYPIEGGATIERCVPLAPLSREVGRLVDLRRTLAVYRMVFGQPRQDDLIEFLLTHFPDAEIQEISRRLRIDLSPRIAPIQAAVPASAQTSLASTATG